MSEPLSVAPDGTAPESAGRGDRLAFSASVDVQAEAAQVFTLMSDLRRKARLNPNIHVIRVELLGEEPIREGSVFYHRFQRGGRIVEYRSWCIRCEPPRLFQSRSETDPPFEVRVTVDPLLGGCRVTQEEMLELTPGLMDALEPVPGNRTFREALGWMGLFPSLRPLGAEVRALQRERLERRLSGELIAWLEAIKAHVESDEVREGREGERA